MDAETQASIHEKFQKAMHLLEVESPKDPEEEPYKSKYAARDLLNDVKFQLERHIEQSGGLLGTAMVLVVIVIQSLVCAQSGLGVPLSAPNLLYWFIFI